MSQAIAIFSPESSLLHNSQRSDKVQLHWILNLFAMLAAAGGFGSIYLNKEIAGKKHFTTWHGTFGLITFIGVFLQLQEESWPSTTDGSRTSLHSSHDYHVLGLLHQLVQKPSGRLPLEVHVLVANNPANLCGQTSHPELLAEGGQANTH